MDKKKTYLLLMSLIRHQMTGIKPDGEQIGAMNKDVLEALYNISHKLDFAHVVYCSLKELGVTLDEELEKKYRKEYRLAAHRVALMDYEIPRIKEVFESVGIPHVFLKGAVIRGMYPKNVIRTSCDIDVLVKEEDLEKASLCLERIGYTRSKEYSHEITFFSQSEVSLELHFTLCSGEIKNVNDVLGDAWKHTCLLEDGALEFSKEFFLFYVFAHMAKHFFNGGCGIKALCDIWAVEKALDISHEDIKEMLEKANIYKFSAEMSQFSKSIFFGKDLTRIQEDVLTYIIEGGVYGNSSYRLAVSQNKNGKLSYFFQRLFVPYDYIKRSYPILEKAPILLPVFWVVRIFDRFFSKDRNAMLSEISITLSANEDIRALIKHLDL